MEHDDDGFWYLTSPHVSGATEAPDARDAANALLDDLNFGASLRYPEHGYVPPIATVIGPDGHQYTFATGHLVGRFAFARDAHGTSSGAAPVVRRRSDAELAADLRQLVPAVSEVAAQWHADHATPVGLYKVFEVIRAQAGGDLSDLMSRNQQDRFTRSANHPVVDGSRHAVPRPGVVAPPDPMYPPEMTRAIG